MQLPLDCDTCLKDKSDEKSDFSKQRNCDRYLLWGFSVKHFMMSCRKFLKNLQMLEVPKGNIFWIRGWQKWGIQHKWETKCPAQKKYISFSEALEEPFLLRDLLINLFYCFIKEYAQNIFGDMKLKVNINTKKHQDMILRKKNFILAYKEMTV